MSDASRPPDATDLVSSPISSAAERCRDEVDGAAAPRREDAGPDAAAHSAGPDAPHHPHRSHNGDDKNEPQETPATDAPDAPSGADASDTPYACPPDRATEENAESAEPHVASEAARAPSFGQYCFSAAALGAPLFLVLIWLFQSLPWLVGRQAHGLSTLAEYIRTLTGKLGGVTAADNAGTGGLFSPVQPIYDLFLNGIAHSGLPDALTSLSIASGVFFTPMTGADSLPVTGAALAALLLLLATWGLALAAGYGKRGALAAACALFVMLALAGLPSSAGESLLTAAIIMASMICLYSGWVRPFAPLRLGAGFALTALAALSGGIIGLALPLLTSLLFLLWRGNFRRAGALDGALGFGLLVVLLLGRAAFLALWGSEDAAPGGKAELLLFIDSAFVKPLSLAWDAGGADWWRVFPPLLTLCLPFALLLPFLNWGKAGNVFAAFVKNRGQCPGHGWIWALLASDLLLFCLLGMDAPAALPAVLAPLAILVGQAVLSLTPGRSRIFYLVLSLLLFAAGLYLGVGGAYTLITGAVDPWFAPLYPVSAPDPAVQWEVLAQAGLCLIFALLLRKSAGRGFPAGSLLTLTLFAACIALPLAWRPPSAAEIPSGAAATPEKAVNHEQTPAGEGEVLPGEEPIQKKPVQEKSIQAVPLPDDMRSAPIPETLPAPLPAPAPGETDAGSTPAEGPAAQSRQAPWQPSMGGSFSSGSGPSTPEHAQATSTPPQDTDPNLSPSSNTERQ